ncbi:MAG: SIS domain-containing protein [Clostridiales bacterium]|nr:SIS domain-containing protein [Clostridiales bacterium]
MTIIDELICRYPALESSREAIASACEIIVTAYKNGGKVLTCGNGGSAADSEHIVGELMKSFCKKRPLKKEFADKVMNDEETKALADNLQGTLEAISLVSQSALISAFANDMDPDYVYAQQVYGYAKDTDVLIALTTSGNSKNTLYAAMTAQALGCKVISITGKSGGKIQKHSDCNISIDETETYKVQELTLPVYHAICLYAENELF